MILRRKCIGAKHSTEAAELVYQLVGERTLSSECRSEELLELKAVSMPV